MRKISTFLLAISCAIAVILSTSCKKEEDAIPAPSTTFDKSVIESKTYNLGDSVITDIDITPNRAVKEIKATVTKMMSGGFSQEILLVKSELNDNDQKFTYKLKFKLDDTFKGISKAPITIAIYFSKPDEGGRSGIELAIFNVNINP